MLSRKTAHSTFRAIDNTLFQTRGVGLSAFTREAPGMDASFSRRPLLTLHYDECSVNLSLWAWAAYCKQMRIMAIRDVFHREWNDVKLALKAAGLWWVVLLTTIAFILPFGAWKGSSWFEQMKEAIADQVARSPHGSILVDELCEGLCRDQGATPHNLCILNTVARQCMQVYSSISHILALSSQQLRVSFALAQKRLH